MKGIRTLLMALLALALPVAGRPAEPVFSADLDTKEGHFSTWKAEGIERTLGCSFVAEMVAAYRDKSWGSAMTFSVQGTAQNARLSLQLWRPRDKDVLNARLLTFTDTGVERTDLEFVAALHHPLAVKISWPPGSTEFKVGDKVIAALDRAFVVTAMQIAVSTAQVKLDSIEFQHAIEAGASNGPSPPIIGVFDGRPQPRR
jgi:hypothetical protein